MHQVNRSAIITASPETVFKLVDDFSAYETFLPWCTPSEEVSREANKAVGRLEINAAGMRQSFTTENTLTPFQQIEMQLVEGPFSHLHGIWGFKDLNGEGCEVTLNLSFKFSNGLLDTAFAPFFNRAIDSMVDAFCQHAQSVSSS